MEDSPIPAPPRKPLLPAWLVATGIIAFAVFSASVAGLTVWLLDDFDKAPPTDTEWHEGTVIAIGGRLIHRLDGRELCQVEDADARAPRSGVLAFHMAPGTAVEFKDVRLKRLGATDR